MAFAYLVGERHRPVARDELADVVWGERLPPSWDGALSVLISKLRRLGELGLERGVGTRRPLGRGGGGP